MKTFKQFRTEIAEAEGFKNKVQKRKSKKKSYVDDRSQKINALKRSTGTNKELWPGLE